MQTLREAHSHSAHYWGQNEDWLIAWVTTRDSDALSRSNFRVFRNALEALPEVKDWAGEDSPVTVERSNHWAVGWVDYLVINPECKPAVELAEKLIGRLVDYPVLDENDFLGEEQSEASEVWKNCYGEKERIDYIRDHRQQFEFNSFSDLIQCVRGKYFCGYASELLH